MTDRPTRRVALFRAVNVGGHAKLPMAALKAMAVDLGLSDPRTLLASGNLVFGADEDDARLERRLAAATRDRFSHEPDVFIRSTPDWRALIEANPFADLARDDPAHLLVMPLGGTPAAGAEAALRAAIVGRERVLLAGRTAYLAYPDGIGRSKLSAALVERHLGVRGTARNWATVIKIAAMLA